MEVVIDSNILFRTLISQGDIFELLFNDKLRLFAPLRLIEEFLNNKEEIIEKSNLSNEDFNRLSLSLFRRIHFVPVDEYKSFIPKARELLGKHEKDEDFVALCLLKNIEFWTYESLLFEIGLGISTKQISDRLSNE